MQNEDEIYAEKTKYQAETETLKKQAQETQQKMQDMLLDNALKDAFTEGRRALGCRERWGRYAV